MFFVKGEGFFYPLFIELRNLIRYQTTRVSNSSRDFNLSQQHCSCFRPKRRHEAHLSFIGTLQYSKQRTITRAASATIARRQLLLLFDITFSSSSSCYYFQKKAEKKLNRRRRFDTKYEDAADLLEKARDSYKLAKSCNFHK